MCKRAFLTLRFLFNSFRLHGLKSRLHFLSHSVATYLDALFRYQYSVFHTKKPYFETDLKTH